VGLSSIPLAREGFEAGSLVLKGRVVNGYNGVGGDVHENIHL